MTVPCLIQFCLLSFNSQNEKETWRQFIFDMLKRERHVRNEWTKIMQQLPDGILIFQQGKADINFTNKLFRTDFFQEQEGMRA